MNNTIKPLPNGDFEVIPEKRNSVKRIAIVDAGSHVGRTAAHIAARIVAQLHSKIIVVDGRYVQRSPKKNKN